ncbi:MAG TPA: GTPase ObgE [Patescibacteria group bacterium]|nr:GTPase ObgE [Patescibacteria group bacterium]
MALIDDITIRVAAGNGGDGGRSFHQNHGTIKSTGDGGNGGNGGSIYFQGTTNLTDLNEFRFRKVIEAPNGVKGMNKNLDGKKGEDITVLVPLGTTIIDTATQIAVEILEKDKPILIARGGHGQTGNHDRRLPHFAEEGLAPDQIGERKELHLVLNLIADIGLIGLPNAGKSSLLATLTRAVPKIANYPFTTLEPNLGTMDKVVLADIPGLIEGASEGRGLGIQFLKHIQKTKVLLHCIDSTDENVYKTYQTIRNEFKEYDPTLLEKKEIILLTKIDLVDEETLKKRKTDLKKTKREILTVSIYNQESIDDLKKFLLNPELISVTE